MPVVHECLMLCDFDINSRQDEEYYSELSAWLWFICRQKDDAVCQHCTGEVSYNNICL